MNIKKPIIVFILILSIVSLTAVGVSMFALYKAALEEQSDRLVDTVVSQARLMESIISHSIEKDGNSIIEATQLALEQVSSAHSRYPGFGDTGEIVLGTLEDETIIFLLNHRHSGLNELEPITLSSTTATPMIQALRGFSGCEIGLDYRNELVLAAYEPVIGFNMAFVAKMDMSEIRQPFVSLITQLFILTIGLIFAGAYIFNIYYTMPLINHLYENEQQLVALNEKFKKSSFNDGLTKIANRKYFDLILDREWSHAQRSKSWISVIMIDIDNFKSYNDKYGHLKGDDCLKNIAKVMQSTVKRETDFLARFGGEEFVILLPKLDVTQAVTVANDVRDSILKLQIPHGDSSVSPFVTVSMGVAAIKPDFSENSDTLISNADERLYKAKDKGRNTIVSE